MSADAERLEGATRENGAPNLKGIDYLELYVGNAHQAAHFYSRAFGFTPVAYSGLETGARDRASYVIRLSNVTLVLTAALRADSPVAEHVKLHGDGVKDIAFEVGDVARAFEQAVGRGARPVAEPFETEDEFGRATKATIASFGDIVHSFVKRDTYAGAFLPKFLPFKNARPAAETGISNIDHVAFTVEAGTLQRCADFYVNTLGFHESHQENIATEYSAMNSKVVQNGAGSIIFPMTEPVASNRVSQIDEYLTFHQGPGVQHIALLCEDIVETVRRLQANGVEFLYTPDTYYEQLEARVGKIDEEIVTLRELNILVDRDESGYLMQIFTKHLQNRPTLFVEAIQRSGARGFGGGNIKALYEAVERQQILRGTL